MNPDIYFVQQGYAFFRVEIFMNFEVFFLLRGRRENFITVSYDNVNSI